MNLTKLATDLRRVAAGEMTDEAAIVALLREGAKTLKPQWEQINDLNDAFESAAKVFVGQHW